MSKDWFSHVQREFQHYTKRFVGQPITYVEIGCWTGRSAQFAAEHILTHSDARGYGIDPYLPMGPRHTAESMKQVQYTARQALLHWERRKKWQWVCAKSQDALRTWANGQIDLLYIDGSHDAADVMLDFCFAWPHLKVGSVAVFDDYGIGVRNRLRRQMPEVPDACEAVMMTFGLFVKQVGCRRQFALEVTSHPELGRYLHPDDITRFTLPDLPNRRDGNHKKPATIAEIRAGRLARRRRLAAEQSRSV